MKGFIVLFILAIAGCATISCSTSDNHGSGEECVGIDFSEIACAGEFLSANGLRLGCDECISDSVSEEFSIEFSPLLVSADEVPEGVGTQFGIIGEGIRYIPEFEDCNTVNLYEIVQNQSGENIKGDFAGRLENIETFIPDELSLFINVPDLHVENTFCGFCFAPVRPPCADDF